jgi:hypothetical protein
MTLGECLWIFDETGHELCLAIWWGRVSVKLPRMMPGKFKLPDSYYLRNSERKVFVYSDDFC